MDLPYLLNVLRRRLWILILVPALAVAAVVAVSLAQPVKYTATAVVAAPALVGGSTQNQYTGSSGSKDYLANFNAAATSPIMTSTVAGQTGAAKSLVSSCLSTAPIGASSLLNVTCATTHRKIAGPVAQADAADTLRFLFQTQVTVATQAVSQAQATLQSASASLLGYENRYGVLLDQTYGNTQILINQLQQEQDSEIANGHAAAANGVRSQVIAAKTRLTQLGPQVAKYDQLVADRADAQTRYDNAVNNSRAAQEQFGAADPTKAVSLEATTEPARLSSVLNVAVPAAVGGLFLAIVIVAVLELLRRRPASADARRDAVVQPISQSPTAQTT